MNLRRTSRVIRGRWGLLLGLGVLVLAAGLLGASLFNRSIRPAFSAEAFFAPAAATDSRSQQAQSSQQLREAADKAIAANAELLASGGGSNIAADQGTGQVVFSARARKASQAIGRAEEMRANYVISEFGAIDVGSRMQIILDEAIQLSESLASLRPPPVVESEPVLSPEEEARLDFLIIQVDALKGESARLVGELVLAETGDSRVGSPEDIQEQIDLVNQKLTDLYTELETTPGFDQSLLDRNPSEADRGPDEGSAQNGTRTVSAGSGNNRTDTSIPEDQESIGPGWQILALETRYAELQTSYQTLFLGSLTGINGSLEPAIVADVTPAPIPLALAGGSGLLAGALAGALILFIEGRVRKPMWVSADVPVAPAWEVPVLTGRRRRRERRAVDRRRAIQQMRSSLITAIDSRSGRLALFVSGLRVPRAHIQELARDLASAMSDVDRLVLVIDLDSDPDPNDTSAGMSLADMLALAHDDVEAAQSELKQLVTESSGNNGVRWLPAGRFDTDPVDALQSRNFGALLSQAGEMVDLVVILASEFDDVLSRALFQRVDGVIPVGRVAKSRDKHFSRFLASMVGYRAIPVGSVLLSGARRDPDRPGRRLHLPKFDRSQAATATTALAVAVPTVEIEKQRTTTAASFVASVPMSYRRKLAKSRVRMRMPTSKWRDLPDFLIIGTQRGGTSSLYKYLGQHPQVRASVRKETEYLSSRFDQGERWYRAHFPLDAHFSSNGSKPILRFEADPSYLLDPRAAARAREIMPEAKVVVLLREPGARALSHHAHNVRLGLEPLTLKDALDAEEERLEGEMERMLSDPAYSGKQYQKFSYTARGFYAEQLERWLNLFPVENFYAVKSEDFFSRTGEVYADLIAFLGLPPWTPKAFRNYSAVPAADRPAVAPDGVVSDLLKTRFEGPNQRLSELLNWELDW